MKKVMIVLLCVNMQAWGYTIVKVGARKVVGRVQYKLTKHQIDYINFVLDRDNQHVFDIAHSSSENISITEPMKIEFKIKDVAEKSSPFTICIINADVNPVTISWSIDRGGALDVAYRARETAFNAAIEQQKKKFEEERDRQIKQLVDNAVSGAGEGERKASAIPGGPAID